VGERFASALGEFVLAEAAAGCKLVRSSASLLPVFAARNAGGKESAQSQAGKARMSLSCAVASARQHRAVDLAAAYNVQCRMSSVGWQDNFLAPQRHVPMQPPPKLCSSSCWIDYFSGHVPPAGAVCKRSASGGAITVARQSPRNATAAAPPRQVRSLVSVLISRGREKPRATGGGGCACSALVVWTEAVAGDETMLCIALSGRHARARRWSQSGPPVAR